MILILSNEEDSHLQLVTEHLRTRGAPFHLFDPAWFPRAAELAVRQEADGTSRAALAWRETRLELDQVSAVWVRRPGRPEAADEVRGSAEREWVSSSSRECLAGLWETLDCRWLPGRPSVVEAGYNKVMQLPVAARAGFRVPSTLVGNSPRASLEFYADSEGQLVTKHLRPFDLHREGQRFEGWTHTLRRRDMLACRSLAYAPAILQEYVPKARELRVTVVGTRVFAAAIDSQASRLTRHDWRHYDNERARYSPFELPAPIRAACRRLLRALGLTFGAIDLVVTPEGEYVFIEINPNGQWGWVEDLTRMQIGQAIADFLIGKAARKRRR